VCHALEGRMHGLVALEIDGHIHPVAGNPAALHRAEMRDLSGHWA
jgi:hypothetical protein